MCEVCDGRGGGLLFKEFFKEMCCNIIKNMEILLVL